MADHDDLETTFNVSCPYCGEHLEIYVEPDVMGTLVQDCEVCCRPWQVRVGDAGERYVEVRAATARSDGHSGAPARVPTYSPTNASLKTGCSVEN